MLKCEFPIGKQNSPTPAWDKPNGERTSGKPLWREGYCSTIALLPKKNGVGGEWGEVGQDGCCVCKVSKRDDAGRTLETLELW